MNDTVIDIELLPPSEASYREDLQKDVSELPKVPAPIYRHAAPSAPWPWMDFDADDSQVLPLPPGGLGQDPEWDRYPQSLFGNWTRDQVERCGILRMNSTHNQACSVHRVDVLKDGEFDKSEDRTVTVEHPRAFWDLLQDPPFSDIRVRALFVENMTVPVLQILGTKYNVEPFFFASSVNWIPSRYQEDPKPDEDHITVVLPFIRMMKNQKPITRTRPVRSFPLSLLETVEEEVRPYKDEKQIIDTQAPLLLPDNQILLQDLLSIHMHRTSTTSTIISYHPSSELQRTSAKRLQSLVQRTGDSVYWSKIFKRSKDPTFLFLASLWYALYAWDEAFEVLYRYINSLESDVLRYNDIKLTRELHKLQAHLLYYQQLLRDFQVSVEFVRNTPNPAMSVLETDPDKREDSTNLLHKEADNITSEIKRLTGQRVMLSDRLQNVIHLAFASVNITDSKAMQSLAVTTMIDSAAMKQISYLAMIFLPASFLANVFSMNVHEINPPTIAPLARYVEITVGLTILTSWVAIALQVESTFHPRNCNIWRRAFWPLLYPIEQISIAIKKRREKKRRWEFPLKRRSSLFPITPSMSTTGVQPVSSLTRGDLYRRRFRRNVQDFPKVPTPRYRHAAPSAPWPWMDLDKDTSEVQPVSLIPPEDSEWGRYPQSLFGNWTHEQVNRSQMLTKCSDSELSTIYKFKVFDDGSFDKLKQVETRAVRKDDAADLRAYWNHLGVPPPQNVRVQALFVEDMTLPVLRMLGTKYIIEPFLFASSVNWTPSRYREDAKPLEDHITVILPFVRVLKEDRRPITRTKPLRIPSIESQSCGVVEVPLPYTEGEQIIDTHAPLSLPENKVLIQDLLSLHMVRKTTTSTIISYHPSLQGTSAKRLQSLAHRTGDSVYWSNIYKRSKDPTFLFLAILWYALYAWDEAFEVLFHYINALEYRILQFNDIKLPRELHKLQAHLLYYQQLLQEFLRSVEFVRGMPSPAMNAPSISEAEREDSAHLLRTEADNLISEIKRLTRQREMLFDRLENAIQLTFATVNITDSKTMQRLAKVTVKDSAAIKQIAYFSIVFLPATYLANVFSMNVQGIADPNTNPPDTIADYVAAAVCLTVLTSWVAIALQKDSSFYPPTSGVMRRTLWPLYYAYGGISTVITRWFKSTSRRPPRDTRSSAASRGTSTAGVSLGKPAQGTQLVGNGVTSDGGSDVVIGIHVKKYAQSASLRAHCTS
ncbi:hypothetical protein EV363DRAFT_1404712 [Boletus edulis]|nr:hypothetical protein EV363DRAFT_1404712 [Boletus edulis]